ncbi:MAG TPA: hypothetical protein VI231_09550 [Candidatus Binatia bacterium]|jgi:hypothetical protein
MITDKRGEAAAGDIERWAGRIIEAAGAGADVSVYYDGDSSTYVLRLARGSHVLLFRLSEAQVHTPAREAECEKTLRTKLKNL